MGMSAWLYTNRGAVLSVLVSMGKSAKMDRVKVRVSVNVRVKIRVKGHVRVHENCTRIGP